MPTKHLTIIQELEAVDEAARFEKFRQTDAKWKV